MPDRPSVLSIIESKVGFEIVGARLSAPLQSKIIELQRGQARIDSLRFDIESVNGKRTNYLVLLFGTMAFGAFGVILGLTGLFQGFLGNLGASLTIVASIGIFVGDYYIAQIDTRLHSVNLVSITQLAHLSIDFDAQLENVARAVLSELNAGISPKADSPAVPWPKGE